MGFANLPTLYLVFGFFDSMVLKANPVLKITFFIAIDLISFGLWCQNYEGKYIKNKTFYRMTYTFYGFCIAKNFLQVKKAFGVLADCF